MSEFLIPLGVMLLGVIVGFADSIVGSGGLLSIPMLIFFGLPPQVAIATDRLGSVGQIIGALAKYWKAQEIVWKYVPIFSILSLLGAVIGANILLSIDPTIMQRVIGAFLLLTLPILFVRNHKEVKRVADGIVRKVVGYSVYFLIMVYNGFLGTGADPLVIYCSRLFFRLSIIKSNATTMIPWFILSVVSLVIFTQKGIVDYSVGIMLLVGMTIGGYIGAHTLLKISDTWVKRLFISVVLISGVKLLFF